MKTLLFWIAAGVTGFLAWQWFLGRRTPGVSAYIDATNGSRQANARAATAQLDVWSSIAAPLALFKPVVGIVANWDPVQPVVRKDGTVVKPTEKRLSDFSEPAAGLLYRN